MTFDIQVASIWKGALEDLRDKVSGMAGWSVADPSLDAEGYFVLEAPIWDHMDTPQANPDQILIGSGALSTTPTGDRSVQTYDHLYYAEGSKWEVTSDYTFDMARRGGSAEIDPGVPSADDDVEYWLSYAAETGFAFYIRRVQGDGNDGAAFYGYNRLDPDNTYWDVFGADSTRDDTGAGVQTIWGSDTTRGDPIQGRTNYMLDPGDAMLVDTEADWYADYRLGGECYLDQDQKGMTVGSGLLNPDANFSNYIWQSAVAYLVQIRNNESNQGPAVGELYHHYLRDESRSDLNTGDVIQDSQGNDEFMIVDYHGGRVAMRAV